jgi:hypothetical protein
MENEMDSMPESLGSTKHDMFHEQVKQAWCWSQASQRRVHEAQLLDTSTSKIKFVQCAVAVTTKGKKVMLASRGMGAH